MTFNTSIHLFIHFSSFQTLRSHNLNAHWGRSERFGLLEGKGGEIKADILKERDRRSERSKASQSTTSHPSMRKVCHHKEDNDVQVSKNQSLTCVGVGIVAVAGAGVLGVAGVEAAVGWGLVLGTGCVEETVFAVGWTGVRGVTFGAGGSARSTLFSWRVMLSEWRGPHIQVTTFSLCRYLTQTKYSEFNCYFWDQHTQGLRIQVVV